MIVIPGDSLVDESSPLKATSPYNAGEHRQHNEAVSAPPPYGAAAAAPSQAQRPFGLNIVTQHRINPQQSRPPQPPAPAGLNRKTLKRFLRAFLVAIVVLVLWGMLIDSLEDQNHRTPHRRSPVRFLWIQTILGYGPSNTPNPCTPSDPSSTPISPSTPVLLRPLPIQYPPYIPRSSTRSIPTPYQA